MFVVSLSVIFSVHVVTVTIYFHWFFSYVANFRCNFAHCKFIIFRSLAIKIQFPHLISFKALGMMTCILSLSLSVSHNNENESFCCTLKWEKECLQYKGTISAFYLYMVPYCSQTEFLLLKLFSLLRAKIIVPRVTLSAALVLVQIV